MWRIAYALGSRSARKRPGRRVHRASDGSRRGARPRRDRRREARTRWSSSITSTRAAPTTESEDAWLGATERHSARARSRSARTIRRAAEGRCSAWRRTARTIWLPSTATVPGFRSEPSASRARAAPSTAPRAPPSAQRPIRPSSAASEHRAARPGRGLRRLAFSPQLCRAQRRLLPLSRATGTTDSGSQRSRARGGFGALSRRRTSGRRQRSTADALGALSSMSE